MQLPEIRVVLGGQSERRRAVVSDATRRGEVEAGRAIERRVQNRVQYEVPWTRSRADDRRNLAAPPRLIPVLCVEAQLEVDAIKKASGVCVRHREQCSQLCPIELEGPVACESIDRVIRPRLEPISHTIRPLQRPIDRALWH